MSALAALLNRVRRRGPSAPELSLPVRRAACAAAVPAVLAVAWTGQLWLPAGLTLAGLAAGHFYSWRAARRAAPDRRVQLAVFAALHLALAMMFAGLFIGLPLPQAQFALYALAITSFDLRTRLNLFSSLGLGLVSLYVAATLSRDYAFGLFILVFVILALRVFSRAEEADGEHGARLTVRGPARGTRAASGWLGFGPAALLFSAAAFLLLPRFASRPLVPPFSITVPIRGGVSAQVVNPGAPLVQINGVYEPDPEGDYYYGFDTRLDLRYRGGLSDAVVMYVRSPAWSYWRSHSYDSYDGQAWSQSDTSLVRARRWNRVIFDIPAGGQALGEEVAQSFYIVRDQPNLIFAAYRPATAIINAEQLALDAGDGLRVGQPLAAGTTYTILSRRPDFSAEALRAAAGVYPPEVAERYLQLPDNISGRVRSLARDLTAAAPTAYDKAAVLRDYLLTIPYDFFPPPQPPGSETVDNFLFVDRRGVCEQYATALTVMLRSEGIPARIAAGYGAGEYNPLSGYYTVRASDAHAWVEVYFPGYGWVPFDPTPGWTPAPYTAPVQRWILSGAFDGLSLPWGQMISSGAALAGAALAPLGGLVGLVVLIGCVWLGARVFRSRRRRAPQRAAIDGDPSRRRILAAYQAALKKLKLRRAPSQTPRELARRVPGGDWDELTAAVEQAAYRTAPPSPELAQRAGELVRQLGKRKPEGKG